MSETVKDMPGGILINSETGRFHPIFFRWAPLPSEGWASPTCRYKSKAHHTAGFATLEEAQEWFAGDQAERIGAYDTGQEWDWDGQDIPAIVAWFEVRANA